MNGATIEPGRLARVALVRLRPNVDLVEGVEQACADVGFEHAIVRGGVGSLVDATLACGSAGPPRELSVEGPGVEVLTLLGELRPGGEGRPEAALHGTVGDPRMRVLGGRFVRGKNLVCITLELVLQEWLPDDAGAARPGAASGGR